MILGHGHHVIDIRTMDEPDEHRAARQAARTAFLKALGMSRAAGDILLKELDPSEIEVKKDPNSNKPSIVLYGRAKEAAEQRGVDRISVSLSHDDYYGAAVVILEKKE